MSDDDGKGALRATIGLVVRGYLADDQIEDIATAVLRLGFRLPAEGTEVEWGRRYENGAVETYLDWDHDRARDAVRPNTEVVYRMVGPWKADED